MRLENEDDTMVLDWVYSVDVCMCLYDTTDMSRGFSAVFGAKKLCGSSVLDKIIY